MIRIGVVGIGFMGMIHYHVPCGDTKNTEKPTENR